MNRPVTCEEFDDAVDELAVDGVDEPRRSELLDHAAGCARCQARLDELAAVADRMLLLAPAVEPPPGFESRALARMAATTTTTTRPSRLLRPPAAAALLLVALAVGILVGRTTSEPTATRSGTIVSAAGARVGTVALEASPRPHVVIAVDSPGGRAGGVRSCELVMADGRTVVVGDWTSEEIASGVWATAVDKDLLDARAMRILGDDGRVIATAELSRR